MKTIDDIIGRNSNLDIMKRHLNAAVSGKGSIVCISGESGMGKTHLLSNFCEYVDKKTEDAGAIFVDGLAPIGKVKVGNIQPLYPFAKAIEKLKEVSPEKKFAKNLGLTMLSSLPLAGEVFYFVKEAGRDWREFREDKSSTGAPSMSSAAKDYYDTLSSMSSKGPLVIFMDDMHWSDAQSVELLISLAEGIDSMPLMLVVSFKQSILDKQGLPFSTFVNNYCGKNKNVTKLDLHPFNAKHISEYVTLAFQGYKKNEEFEAWLKDRSFGVPGVLAEYMRYFDRYSPFLPDGSLVPDFKSKSYLPVSAQSMFSQALELLNEDEKNILSVCCAEGKEFTVNIISQLLNLDVLTTIKKLRAIQNKAGVIKSAGAQYKYGIKTTLYRFTQGFYHDFFEGSLEFEEYQALHGHIASILQERYDESPNDELRDQIAPYLAAHSAEAGDEETAKNMLLVSAKAAQKYGNEEVIQEAFAEFSEIGMKWKRNPEDDPAPSPEIEFRKIFGFDSITEDIKEGEEYVPPAVNGYYGRGEPEQEEDILSGIPEFSSVRARIIELYLSGQYEKSISIAESAISKHYDYFQAKEIAQLYALAAKGYVEEGNHAKAESSLELGLRLLEQNPDLVAETLLFNTYAMLKFDEGKNSEAYNYLDRAAKKAMSLPSELRLLTLANIGIMMKDYDPEKASTYIEAALKLARTLGMKDFIQILQSESSKLL